MAVINGGSGNDSLKGTAGADTILGNAGRDTIDPGHGNDSVDGGAGADVLIWNANSATKNNVDTYLGGSTGESYDSNPYGSLSGGDRLHLGTTGKDAFRVTFTNSEDGYALDPYGNRLNFTGIERLQTGAGNDHVDVSGASLKVARGSGSDYVPVHGVTVNTGAGNDYIHGSRGDDVLDGGDGNDTIYGGAGGDLLMPSQGNDYGHAGDGDDNVRWGNNGGMGEITNIGNDTLVGGNGHDLLNIWAKAGYSENGTGAVVNFTSSSSGTATFAQANGKLTFSEFEQYWTHEGKDTVSAASANIGVNEKGIWFGTRWGDDRLTGSNGRDTLEGGDGADTIDGGRGNDLISMYESVTAGGIITPDNYRDVLVVRDGAGIDTIRGFQVGDIRGGNGQIARYGDRLDVSGLHDKQGNLVDVNDVKVAASGTSAVLSFPNGEQIVLQGVSASSLTKAVLGQLGIPTSSAQSASATTAQAATLSATGTDATATKTAVAAVSTETAVQSVDAADKAVVADAVVDTDAGADVSTGSGRGGWHHQPVFWNDVMEAFDNAVSGHPKGWQAFSDLVESYARQAVADADHFDFHRCGGHDFDWS